MSFEIVDRAAAGRIGRYKTEHGTVTTPTLLPVINPNIDLVPAREMRDRFGCEMVITNSYVIHKHENLREAALADGVHRLIDWDGPVMTDSGTFQMYVYGDVEVGPSQIIEFQADMGVDVATCLDLFVTPDMDRHQAEEAVATTIDRTKESVATLARLQEAGRGSHTRINATVQGGLELDLRKDCAHAYRDLDVGYHTIGGVVPVMERQMYPALVDMILWSQQGLRKDRPVHLFGAGHPLVFPLATALGCDVFDSSSYAKYAKDGRIMTPTGTLHVHDQMAADEWPVASEFLHAWTPTEFHQDLRKGWRDPDGKKAERALALHNLDVCFADIRLIRQHIREGNLWELVERRAAAHPLLAAALRRLARPEYQAWLEAREPVSGAKAMKYTGSATHGRPQFARIRHRLLTHFTPLGVPVESEVDTHYAAAGEEKLEIAMHKEPLADHGAGRKPYGSALGDAFDPDQDHVVINALGPTPLGLDEAYPFSQSFLPALEGLDRGHMGWVGETKDLFLEAHGFMPAIPGPPGPDGGLDRDLLQVIRTADWQFGPGAGLVLAGMASPDQVREVLQAAPPEAGKPVAALAALAAEASHGDRLRCDRSRKTGKMRTVHLDGQHILSLRAGDGLWTLKPAGAKLLHAALPAPTARVVVDADSVPFNRDGKSVFAKFVDSVDPGLRPQDECLVVDPDDALVAVGRLMLAADEAADFETGMAVKVRDGLAA